MVCLLLLALLRGKSCPFGIQVYLVDRCICSSSAAEEAPTVARDKFGNQKAISSDMYFGRGSYDPVTTAEAQNRLQNFSGATSISSSQYFGREEEEEMGGLGGGGVDGGMLGDGTLSGLETAARDAMQRVLANPDVQNAAESIRAGAMKVRSAHFIHIHMLIASCACSFQTTWLRCPSVDRTSLLFDFVYSIWVMAMHRLSQDFSICETNSRH